MCFNLKIDSVFPPCFPGTEGCEGGVSSLLPDEGKDGERMLVNVLPHGDQVMVDNACHLLGMVLGML